MSVRQPRTDATSPAAKKPRPRAAKRSKRWYAVTIVAFACAAIIYLGTNWYAGSSQWQRAEQSAPAHAADESRTGKIVLQTNPDQCAQMEFDNANGHFVDGLKPCDNQVKFDEHGRPIPMGTIHRLDAISRSFFGR
jgi:hypothetical protein